MLIPTWMHQVCTVPDKTNFAIRSWKSELLTKENDFRCFGVGMVTNASRLLLRRRLKPTV
jgi:hypothetical protein